MMDNVICKQCGTPGHCSSPRDDYICVDCKIENMPWITEEEMEEHMKKVDERNNSWRKNIDGNDIDL